MLTRPQIDVQRTPVTLLIALFALAIELVSQLDPERRMFFYNDMRLGIWWQIWTGEVWRPVTTTLLHGGLLHAAFNIYWICVFGPAVEYEFGSGRTFGLFVLLAGVSTMPQYMVSGYLDPDAGAMVGLSGVLYGFFGICFVGRQYRDTMAAVCNPLTAQMLIAWLVLCIVLGAVENATGFRVLNVANIAHVSGLLFGVLYGRALFESRHRQAWIAVAVGCSIVVSATLVYAPGHPGYEHARRVRRVSRGMPVTGRSKGSGTFSAASFSPRAMYFGRKMSQTPSRERLPMPLQAREAPQLVAIGAPTPGVDRCRSSSQRSAYEAQVASNRDDAASNTRFIDSSSTSSNVSE